MNVPVAHQHPNDGAPGYLATSRDNQGSAGHYPVTGNHAQIHSYVPPKPIVPIQAILTCHSRGVPTPTTQQLGSSPQTTHGANVPDLSQRETTNPSPTQKTPDTTDETPTESRGRQQPRTNPATHPRGERCNDSPNTDMPTPGRNHGPRAKINFASLNIKGRMSGNINKWFHIPQIIRENRIGILAIQETHLTEELAKQFSELFGNNLKLFFSPDPDTRNARGVAIVVNKKLVSTEGIKEHVLVPGRALAISLPWHENIIINTLAIYAPNSPRETRDFWKTIQRQLNATPSLSPDIMLGDFNLVEDAIDRIPSNSDDPQSTELLREFKIKYRLTDGWRKANPEEKGYTWSRDSDGTQSRIDRIYIHENLFDTCTDWKISPAPIPSDHDMISANISTPSTPSIGRGRWAAPPRLLKNNLIKKEIQELGRLLQEKLETLRHRSPRRNPQVFLDDFKIKVRNTLRKHEKKIQPMLKKKIASLTEKLREVRNNPNLPEDETRISSVQLKKEIQILLKQAHQSNRDLLSAIDAAEGEKIGKTWSSRHKVAKPRDTIRYLKDPISGGTTRDSPRMAQIAAKYHEDLQHEDHDPHANPDEESLREILMHVKSKLSAESKEKLKESISEPQVREAIKKTTSGKAPGIDGIPTELWKSLDDQFLESKKNSNSTRKCNIVWCLTQVFRDIEVNSMDQNTKLNEGCMSPIYKKKDPDNIANYRPITLLNTDYKIFTKALSMKLSDVITDIINPDQAGFIKNRNVYDQIKTTKLIIDYMNHTNRTGAIVALDQEKAYNKILHPYLWAVLRKLEFPEEFIKTTQALYDGAITTVMINGELSHPFPIYRGVRQGDALSCLLFDLAIEPLAENIRKSQLILGIQIPTTKKYLKIKLFADDTTIFLSENDSIENLQTILNKWCKVSGAKFNIEKTEIIPLGNLTQCHNIITKNSLTEGGPMFPQHIHIAKEGEPVRILGAWLGNAIDQATTWAPILEDCCKRLERWSASKHSLEGRRLIIQMQVAGVTQYLTKVQGMPKDVESELNKRIRRFMWNNEKTDTINQAQMYAPHEKGGKKVLDIEARNKAIHLTWLKAYLNIGEERATWTYFADALISSDIPPSNKIDKDPESRVMPILQTWETRSRNSTLPEDLKTMLRLAREYNVRVSAANPSKPVQENLPIWYHTKSVPSARKLYKTKTAKCLRKNHKIKLVSDTTSLLSRVTTGHSPSSNCLCETCKDLHTTAGCTHPHLCINLAATLIEKIQPIWNPTTPKPPRDNTSNEDNRDPKNMGTNFDTNNETTQMKDAITVFGDLDPSPIQLQVPIPGNGETSQETTLIYTDGACINNGDENAQAGSGIWYGDNDPRNISERVQLELQSNQTGELMAVLLAIKNHYPNENLRIMSDSRYVIDGLTKNCKKWEAWNWIDTRHGDIFKCITAWMRWRKGTTTLQWVKGHNGDRGNEQADKLAGEGAEKPRMPENYSLEYPPDQTGSGAQLAKLEQRDFYKIIRDKRKIPQRNRTERNINTIQTHAQDTFRTSPTVDKIWATTKHKDFTRKTRDFIWKATQHAYKIGEYWAHIEGYENRGTCPICNELEDMEHILTKCKAGTRSTAWRLANKIWAKRHTSPLPSHVGDILGCGLANFKSNDKPDKGLNRLYRILVSETAYLIWKLRNERRIRDDKGAVQSVDETFNRWTHALNKRLTTDRILTNSERFKKKAIDRKLVKNTWKNCLKNEEDLPANWPTAKGVLVGISSTCLPGHVG